MIFITIEMGAHYFIKGLSILWVALLFFHIYFPHRSIAEVSKVVGFKTVANQY